MGAVSVETMKLHDLAEAPVGHWQLLRAVALDGDTLRAEIDLGFDIRIQARIRLKGFFAPEHAGRTPEMADSAMHALQRTIDQGGLSMPIRGARRDKYGRCVAVLHQWGKALNPHDVLGVYQLTEVAHRDDLNFARKLRGADEAPL